MRLICYCHIHRSSIFPNNEHINPPLVGAHSTNSKPTDSPICFDVLTDITKFVEAPHGLSVHIGVVGVVRLAQEE